MGVGGRKLPEFRENKDHFQLERITKQFMKMACELGTVG